jgi:hypothetical protein
VPRIGEGVQLLTPEGRWISHDVIDVWYQRAAYGDVWIPLLHVRQTPGEQVVTADAAANAVPQGPQVKRARREAQERADEAFANARKEAAEHS